MQTAFSGFHPNQLQQTYAYLDGCPDNLLVLLLALPGAPLEQRVASLRAWREALLDGKMPPTCDWPPRAMAAPAMKGLEELRLAEFCRGQPDLVNAVLHDLLLALQRGELEFQKRVLKRLAELESLERKRRKRSLQKRRKRVKGGEPRGRMKADKGPSGRASVVLTPNTLEQLRREAVAQVAAEPVEPDSEMIAKWGELVRAWTQLAEVFDELGTLLGRGWDLTRGLLRHAGWRDLVRLHQLVQRIPNFRAVIRSLGRLQDGQRESSVSERIFGPVQRLEEERREIYTPFAPHEVRGIERSPDIQRMLPVETLQLVHPALKMLWHARRAESALLTYRVEGTTIVREQVERSMEEARERPRRVRGPILLVLDTSGSMSGLPEHVAKALALEAVRTAHAEKRGCFLYTFGGPGEILGHELSLDPHGIGRLLDFLCWSFGGGTDAAGVMPHVMDKLRNERWENADVLWLTDGEWPTTEGMLAAVERARTRGTRFHGIQIGNSGKTSLHRICDHVHVFTEWAKVVDD